MSPSGGHGIVGAGTRPVLTARAGFFAGLDLVPSRPVELVVAAAVVALPVMPFWSESFRGTVRFALAAVVVGWIFAGRIPVRQPLFGSGRWLVAAFLLFQCVPLAASGAGAYGFVRAANWIMFIPFAFIRYDARSRRIAFASAMVVGLILAAGVVLQLAGVMSGVWGGLPLGDADDDRSRPLVTRYTSFLLNPNDLALFMLGTAVALYLVSQRGAASWATRLVALLGVEIAMMVLLLTFSRGGLLALPLVLLFLWVAGSGKSVLGLTASAVVAGLLLTVTSPSFHREFEVTLRSVLAMARGTDVSVVQRLELWGDWLATPTNLLIGSGYGGYAAKREVDIVGSEARARLYRSLTVDNGWLKLSLEEGVIGLALFGLVLADGVRRCFALRSTRHRMIGLVVGPVLIAVAFRALSADIFDINPWNFVLWFLLGVSYASADGAGGPGRWDRGSPGEGGREP